MNKRTVLLATVIAATLFTAPLFAATATSNLAVNASVAANCLISTTAVAFGAYDPLTLNATTPAGDLAGTGTVVVTCTKGAGTSIDLGLGLHASGTTRQMNAGGLDNLTYELYQAAGGAVWGTGVNGLTIAVAPSKAARTWTVYGKVLGGQDVAAGNYADTVVATINY